MNISEAIGLVGGLSGLLALGMQGVKMWSNRSPDLRLFVPYHFTGSASHNQQRVLFCLSRISNLSGRPAFIYLETLRAEVLYKGRWYQMTVLNMPKGKSLETDFPEHIRHEAGIKYVEPFCKFDNPVIALNKPYSVYIPVTCTEQVVVENGERIRLEFKDCNLKKFIIETEILKNDPEHN